ncbi:MULTISPECIES: sulfatase-like hydrolase/transferase [unclassified Arcicella]|uniref:sulfatase-like hydrolase/transferase n=1 Tax=unclassified Arcicella TaxID=2644986 RepID=UPI002859298C|nr:MULTISPECIES: sulfatase-like hydrolase/transferase [unclassified Arcicella]MDR6562052.1 arylsulfatase A-like enzyme [Arcicella sp. BE51]MDR6811924.1 arylsulfatase A-like enzyme [Arcicella sp. BE140]MDR6822954.1 arylsulfatase A-like enzyme [Arcicella sp. BE139]
MNRRNFIKNSSLLGASLALHPFLKGLAEERKLNIIVLLSDDQRHDTIGALGNKDIITPNLDALVKNGTAFTQAHVFGGLSGAICQPSRAMLLTGRTLFSIDRQARDNQEFSFDIFNNYVTFPELLRKNNYNTVGIGKQHNGTTIYNRAFSDGAKVFFGGMGDQYNLPVQDYKADNSYGGPKDNNYAPNKVNESKGKHSSELFADETIHFIEKYKKEPFLIYTAFTTPHDPRRAPAEYNQWYADKKVSLPPNFLPQHPFDNGELKVRDELLAPFPRTEEDTIRQIKEYYATISHLDAQIGRIVKAVYENGLAENTLIVFAGDNGLAIGQHGLFGKQSIYEHSNRVPLIFSGPGIPKNQKVDGYCYLSDIYATLAEKSDVKIPSSVQGISLAKAFKDPKTPLRRALYFAFKHFQRGVKKDGFKLLEYNVDGNRHTQLFNLKEDPWEMHNLADEPECKAKKQALKAELLKLKVEFADTFSSFWNGYS